MKKFIEVIIAWCSKHLWQSILIGVAFAGVVATSITLPIVLSNKNDTDNTETADDSETNEETNPPIVPVANTYNVSYTTNENGTIELTKSGEVEEGVEVTAVVTPKNGYALTGVYINGTLKSNTTSYTFTASSDLADSNKNIVVSATFEVVLTGISITGDNEVKSSESITLTAAPVPSNALFNDVTWSIVSGDDIISLPGTKTGNTIEVSGVNEGEAVVRAQCGTVSKEFAITVINGPIPVDSCKIVIGENSVPMIVSEPIPDGFDQEWYITETNVLLNDEITFECEDEGVSITEIDETSPAKNAFRLEDGKLICRSNSGSFNFYLRETSDTYSVYIDGTYNPIVVLTINYDSGMGNALYITGSFNDWSPNNGVIRGTWTEGNNWVFEISQPKDTHVEFKFIVNLYDGPADPEIRKEGGENRSYTFSVDQSFTLYWQED